MTGMARNFRWGLQVVRGAQLSFCRPFLDIKILAYKSLCILMKYSMHGTQIAHRRRKVSNFGIAKAGILFSRRLPQRWGASISTTLAQWAERLLRDGACPMCPANYVFETDEKHPKFTFYFTVISWFTWSKISESKINYVSRGGFYIGLSLAMYYNAPSKCPPRTHNIFQTHVIVVFESSKL